MERTNWQFALDPDVLERSYEAVGRCGQLPVMDRAVQRVLALTQDEQCELTDLVDALEADAGLAANLLRYANSAYVGRPINAKTVRQAVVMIGRQATRQLCLEAVTYRFFESAPGNGGISCGQLHLHAVAVARAAAAAASMASIPTEVPHLAGLLHDCGKLVMPLAFGTEATDEIASAHPSGVARSTAEWDRFGVDHAYAGALFARHAGLGEDLVTAIAWHHGGRRGCVSPNPEVACLQLANTVVGMLGGESPDEALLGEVLDTLNLTVDALDELANSIGGSGAGAGEPQPGGLGSRVAELERLASTDELTGLANRRHWMSCARQAIESGAEGRVLLCDLDHFKTVNDTHGHSTGDLVLMGVASILGRHGLAGRIGGDEFAVWVAGSGADVVADQLVTEVAAAFGDDERLSIGMSVGVAPPTSDLAEALEWADRALYDAKAAGRGRARTLQQL